MGVMFDWSVPRYCAGPCGREMRRRGSKDDGRAVHYGHHKCVKCRTAELRRERGTASLQYVWFDQTHQKCSRCGRVRPLTKFGPKPKARSGRHSTCQQCFDLRYTYGIDFSDYLSMFEGQKGRCKICNKSAEWGDEGNLPLHVDHCHTKGSIRDLLCGNCNRALGLFRESAVVLSAAVSYLNARALRLSPDIQVTPIQSASSRRCTDCHQYRDIALFGEHKSTCRRCRHIRYRYGLSYYQREILETQQGGLCAICREPPKRTLHVDHDHTCCSGSVKGCGACIRGLLCGPCNHGIGLVFENKETLNSMLEYVERWCVAP